MRPNFVALSRTNGEAPAIIRADQITAMLPQAATPKRAAEVLVQLGPTLNIHTSLSLEEIKNLVAQAIGLPMTIFLPEPRKDAAA